MDHNLLQVIDVAVRAAQEWDTKGDANWAARTYVQAVLAALRAAVKLPNLEAGRAFLFERGVPDLLERAVRLSQVLADEIQAARIPASVIGGNYHLSVLAHLAWLVGVGSAAERALAVANCIEIRGLSPEFWAEYADALQRLNQGVPYDPPARHWKREQYWAPYLEFIGDLSHGRDPTESLAMVEAAFNKRNRDRRFLADQYGIEGSGNEPAQWDFRLASLSALSARAREKDG